MEYIVHSTWVGEFDDNKEQIIRTQLDRGTLFNSCNLNKLISDW